MKNKWYKLIPFYCLLLTCVQLHAQENIAPLLHNPVVANAPKSVLQLKKTTALSLPFFEDFTSYSAIPDQEKWTDREVYINNTMCINPISRGVATFDALNASGTPYNTTNYLAVVKADSLTSQVVDLSSYSPADSIYISFFYQPQGNGFSPETGDSLMLFFKKKYGAWTKIWAKEGSTTMPFMQAMIAITDTAYLNDAFQFRFINIASINLNDDIWNLDYIRLDAGRNINDTAVNDLAMSVNPSFVLNDYSYMTYRQFIDNPSNERAINLNVSVKNNYATSQSINIAYDAQEERTSTSLGINSTSGTVPGYSTQQFTLPMYAGTIPLPANEYDTVVFKNTYYFSPVNGTDNTVNDTIMQRQIFQDYLAYDDGTAEQSYFLNMYQTLPAKIAIEYHLNKPDTIKGISIYFGRQVPLSSSKYISMFVNQDIAVNGGSDIPLYQEDLLYVNYSNTVNGFWTYRFAQPVVVPAGVFYIGVSQPAYSGSDSVYYGVDVNRVGGNHLYYNVLNQWVSSSLAGALMVRPILGGPVWDSHVQEVAVKDTEWTFYPNPVKSSITLDIPLKSTAITAAVKDIQGRVVLQQQLNTDRSINLSQLHSGIYFIHLSSRDATFKVKKLIKQ